MYASPIMLISLQKGGIDAAAPPDPRKSFHSRRQGVELSYAAHIGQVEADVAGQIGTVRIEVAVGSEVQARDRDLCGSARHDAEEKESSSQAGHCG